MQAMPTPHRSLALLPLAVFSLLTACSKPEEQSAGQKLDEMAAKTEQAAGALKDEARQAAEQAAQAVGDAAITARIKTALAADTELKALRIGATESRGVFLETPRNEYVKD